MGRTGGFPRERSRGLRAARGRALDHEVSPARAGLLTRRHRRPPRSRC
jgi:hypothetical protein